jgi:hypothetical protein
MTPVSAALLAEEEEVSSVFLVSSDFLTEVYAL